MITRDKVIEDLKSMPYGIATWIGYVDKNDHYEYFCYLVDIITSEDLRKYGFDCCLSDDCNKIKKYTWELVKDVGESLKTVSPS